MIEKSEYSVSRGCMLTWLHKYLQIKLQSQCLNSLKSRPDFLNLPNDINFQYLVLLAQLQLRCVWHLEAYNPKFYCC